MYQSLNQTLCRAHTPISLSVSLSLLCSAAISLYHSISSLSPLVQAVAKKRIGEPVYVLDMLSFFFIFYFFNSLWRVQNFFSAGNVRENQSLPPSSTLFYSLSRSAPSLFFPLTLCRLQSKYTSRSQPVSAWFSFTTTTCWFSWLFYILRTLLSSVGFLQFSNKNSAFPLVDFLHFFKEEEKRKKMSYLVFFPGNSVKRG